MPLGDSGSVLFAGSAEEFVRMAPERSLTTFVAALHATRRSTEESQARFPAPQPELFERFDSPTS